jgi:oligopeptide transport system substrate-binding protein
MGRAYAAILIIVAVLTFAPVTLLSLRREASFEGKTVYYSSYGAKIKSIDPATCGDTTSAAAQGHVYESPYQYHYLKRPMQLEPQLAAALPHISDDGLVYTIPIKKGIRYCPNPCFGVDENGQPKTREVRAQDFVLAFKRIADYHIPSRLAWPFLSGRVKGLNEYREKTAQYKEGDFSRYDLDVPGVRALDDYTLRIELVEPYPQLTPCLEIDNFAPIPYELIDYYLAHEVDSLGRRREIPITQRTAEINKPEAMVGTGPYRLTRWERGNRMIYERNPVYDHGFYPTEGEPGDAEAGLLADAGKPLPFVDVLHYQYVAENLPAWMKFLSMQFDASGIPSDVFEVVITPDKQLTDAWKKKGIRLVKYTQPSVFWLAFNMDDPIVGASPALRQAMCLAFNVEDYIDVLFNGRACRALNILPESFPTHQLAGPGPYYHYDPGAAREKLAAARDQLRAHGRLTPDGKIPDITIDLAGRDEMYRRMGEFIQQQFTAIGLSVKIVLNDWPTLQEKVHNKNAQTYTMGWHADYIDAENFLQLFYTPNIEKGTNNTNYSNPEFDAMYERAKIMNPSPERTDLYVKMTRMISEDCPVLLLTEPEYFVLVYDWVSNYKRPPIGYGTMKYIRIDPVLRRKMGGRN